MKMSDAFELPLQKAVNELAVIDRNDAVVGWSDAFSGEVARDCFVSAINNHDRLVKENADLKTDRDNAISKMSKSWQHNSGDYPDLLSKFVGMANRQFDERDKLAKENAELRELANRFIEGIAGHDMHQAKFYWENELQLVLSNKTEQ